ncbi:unnamed protein product, partial [Coregonus sp. 'balchen']
VNVSSVGGDGVAPHTSPNTIKEGDSPAQFRSKKMDWQENEDNSIFQGEQRKETSKHTLKRPASRLSIGKRMILGSQYTLHETPNQPGSSGHLGMETAELVCSYASGTDSDVLVVHPEPPLVPTVSAVTFNSQVGTHSDRRDIDMIDSQPIELEMDMCSAWTKQAKPEMTFSPLQRNLENISGVSPAHCQLTQGMNTASNFDGPDMMSFAMYEKQSNHPQWSEVQGSADSREKPHLHYGGLGKHRCGRNMQTQKVNTFLRERIQITEKRNVQGHGKKSVAHKHTIRNHLDPKADDYRSPVGKELIHFCGDGEHPSKEEEDPVKQYFYGEGKHECIQIKELRLENTASLQDKKGDFESGADEDKRAVIGHSDQRLSEDYDSHINVDLERESTIPKLQQTNVAHCVRKQGYSDLWTP